MVHSDEAPLPARIGRSFAHRGRGAAALFLQEPTDAGAAASPVGSFFALFCSSPGVFSTPSTESTGVRLLDRGGRYSRCGHPPPSVTPLPPEDAKKKRPGLQSRLRARSTSAVRCDYALMRARSTCRTCFSGAAGNGRFVETKNTATEAAFAWRKT